VRIVGELKLGYLMHTESLRLIPYAILIAVNVNIVFIILFSDGKETEMTPWCIGLLANLCRNNLTVQMYVKGQVRCHLLCSM